MIELLVASVLMIITTLFQAAFISQVRILNGMADLVLLLLISWLHIDKTRHRWILAIMAGILSGLISAIPYWVFIPVYLAITYIINFLRQRIWQVPMVVLFLSSIIGSSLIYGSQYIYLLATGVQIPLADSLNLVILPSVVLNLILILPVYAVTSEIAKILYREEVEI